MKSKTINILFTSVGRRIELLQQFKIAAENLGCKLIIHGADISETAPALAFCECTVIVPRIDDDSYIPTLLEYCKTNHIDALIPTIDTDLLILSRNKESFNSIGTTVVVSDENKIVICRDKRNTAEYFVSLGLLSPIPTDDYKKYTGTFPAFIKPKDGSSSIFAYKVNSAKELEFFANQVPDYIIQPYIDGTEYTVDVFCDFDGNPIYITPRQRLAVRSGEVLKTKIVQDETIINEIKKLISDYKPCGAITVQLIRENITNQDYFIEINPRYGGGAPLTMKAGANSAKALLNLICGKKEKYLHFVAEDDLIFSRFDQSVCLNSKSTLNSVKGIIFDLDDTLYDEKQYVKSGFKAVADFLNIDGAEKFLWELFENGEPAIDTYLKNIGCIDKKADCLKIYREHIPDITLKNGVVDELLNLKHKNFKIGIITDGRPIGQHNKIKALGLEKMVDDIIVTDELGGEQFRKPCDIAFRIMQKKWQIPFEQLMYVGDNISKDFQAPKQLGMKWKFIENTNGIYFKK